MSEHSCLSRSHHRTHSRSPAAKRPTGARAVAAASDRRCNEARAVRIQLPASHRHGAVERDGAAGNQRPAGARHRTRRVHDRRGRLRPETNLRRDLPARRFGRLLRGGRQQLITISDPEINDMSCQLRSARSGLVPSLAFARAGRLGANAGGRRRRRARSPQSKAAAAAQPGRICRNTRGFKRRRSATTAK